MGIVTMPNKVSLSELLRGYAIVSQGWMKGTSIVRMAVMME